MTEHEHQFDPADAGKLWSDHRQEVLPVDMVMDKMGLQKHDVVADLGAGNGYFTIPIATYTNETVYAVDLEPQMLESLKESADHEQLNNIEQMTAELDNTPIPDQSVDKVLVSQVIHEVPSLENAMREFKRILKPDGELFLIDFNLTDSDGPPMHIRIPSDTMAGKLEEMGFSTTVMDLNPDEYAVKAKIAE